MSMGLENIIGDYESFLDRIFENLEKAGLDLSEFKELDHIAYRTETLERYYELKEQLSKWVVALDDAPFNGRPILVARFKDPIRYKGFEIPGLEVLAPKEGNRYEEGLEHSEFVTRTALADFLERHKKLDFKLDSYGREINPEIVLPFESCAVKFHAKSLLTLRSV